jgi:hypothetical protein
VKISNKLNEGIVKISNKLKEGVVKISNKKFYEQSFIFLELLHAEADMTKLIILIPQILLANSPERHVESGRAVTVPRLPGHVDPYLCTACHGTWQSHI